MTICKKCIDAHGYDHALVSNVEVLMMHNDDTTVYVGHCKNCDSYTEGVLTPEEAKERIQQGWYINKQSERTCTIENINDGVVYLSCGCTHDASAYAPDLMYLNYCASCGAKVNKGGCIE